MLVVAVLAFILFVLTRLLVPIVWDRQGRARDDHWLRVKEGEVYDAP